MLTTSEQKDKQAEGSIKKFIMPKDYKPQSIKLDRIDLLKGQENYETWKDQMIFVFDAMGVLEIVVNGAKPAEGADDDEMNTWTAMSKQANLLLAQTLDAPIFKQVVKHRDPHSIWTHLKEQYYCNNTYSFIQQFDILINTKQLYDPNKPV